MRLNTRHLRLVAAFPFIILGISVLVHGTTFPVDLVLAAFGILLTVGSVACFQFVMSQRRAATKANLSGLF